MNRLKLVVALVGMGLLLAAVVLDVTLGMPAWSRIIGWAAIVVLFGAVGIRLIERRRNKAENDD